MLRRGNDPEGPKRRRMEPADIAALARPARLPGDPPAPTPVPEATDPLRDWAQITSFQELDAPLVAELARAAMGSAGVVVLQSGEVAVGAMLASLAIRGHDELIHRLIITGNAELRLHRYSVGQLEPIGVHRVGTIADALRSLAWCAATGSEDTFELVADDGRGIPVAIGAARLHELRWLQPPPSPAPHDAPWADITSTSLPPGADLAWWTKQLDRAATSAPARLPAVFADGAWDPGPAPASAPPVPKPAPLPASFTGPATDGDPAGPERRGGLHADDAAELFDVVAVSVNKALSAALIELEIDPAAIEELRENPTLDETLDRVRQIEQHLIHLGPLNRQIHELTTVIEDLHDTVRGVVRQQWESAPPQNYWNRAQRASDEVQRTLDDLASELRTRLPRTPAE